MNNKKNAGKLIKLMESSVSVLSNRQRRGRQSKLRDTRGPGHYHRRLRAFTLIELLVVVAIIALLVAILVPALDEARNQAIRAVCAAQLHHIGVVTHVYANASDGNLPPRPIPGGWLRNFAQRKMPLLLDDDLVIELIGGYSVVPASWVCPSFLRQETYEQLGTDPEGNSFIGRDWSGNVYPNLWWMGYSLLFNLDQIPGGYPYPIPSAADGLHDPEGVLAADLIKRSGWTWDYWSGFLSAHHPKGYRPEGGNSLFVAGNVRWFDEDELGPKGAKGLDQSLGNWNMYGTGNQAHFWGVAE